MTHSIESLFSATIDAITESKTDYVLYGGIVVGLWGQPRFTEDVDVVLFLAEREFHRFLRAARNHHFDVDEDLCIQQIQISGWSRIPFQKKDSPWHIDVTLGDSPLDQSAFDRRHTVTLFRKGFFQIPVPRSESKQKNCSRSVALQALDDTG